MAKRNPTFTYDPTPGLFVPDLKPGATVTARDQAHAEQLAAHPCFTPVQEKRDATTDTAKADTAKRAADTTED